MTSRFRRFVGGPAANRDVEGLVADANAAASKQKWEDALRFTLMARALAPTSARLVADEAFYRARSGDRTLAAERYMEAFRLAPDAMLAHQSLLAMIAVPLPLRDVESWAVRALKVTPDLSIIIEHDDDLAALTTRAAVRTAIQRAKDSARSGVRGS